MILRKYKMDLGYVTLLLVFLSQITQSPCSTKSETIEADWYGSFTIRECDTGSWAPLTPLDDLYENKLQCDVTCGNGCGAGYGLYENSGTKSEKLICFLAKFRANFKIYVADKKCSCGTYINDKFYNCEKVNPNYTKLPIPVDPDDLQDSCQGYCDSIDVYISKKRQDARIVYCLTRVASKRYNKLTRDLSGECVLRKGHVYCGCGVIRPRILAPLKRDDTVYYFHGKKKESKLDSKGFEKPTDENHDKKLMRDRRRHNFALHTFDPSFRYIELDEQYQILSSSDFPDDQKLPPVIRKTKKPLQNITNQVEAESPSSLGKSSSPVVLSQETTESKSKDRGALTEENLNGVAIRKHGANSSNFEKSGYQADRSYGENGGNKENEIGRARGKGGSASGSPKLRPSKPENRNGVCNGNGLRKKDVGPKKRRAKSSGTENSKDTSVVLGPAEINSSRLTSPKGKKIVKTRLPKNGDHLSPAPNRAEYSNGKMVELVPSRGRSGSPNGRRSKEKSTPKIKGCRSSSPNGRRSMEKSTPKIKGCRSSSPNGRRSQEKSTPKIKSCRSSSPKGTKIIKKQLPKRTDKKPEYPNERRVEAGTSCNSPGSPNVRKRIPKTEDNKLHNPNIRGAQMGPPSGSSGFPNDSNIKEKEIPEITNDESFRSKIMRRKTAGPSSPTVALLKPIRNGSFKEGMGGNKTCLASKEELVLGGSSDLTYKSNSLERNKVKSKNGNLCALS